ncbi:flavin-containing monooxygenase [Myxococcus landrumensis]|uniref:NAD(P)/FAD-dependent oxidoreductase n=1 Tax=Myxococcus landrumensis TaxID=2813577 RepID=A0ABX7N2Y1_9BACT|nr:NAD(P)/FAD-dependent oxidoreductase [Myxococcus landrumus]QSQ12853.1 NAD(P)/FAD-dependent oxidoreductase [Myxococcus landrumus]
MSLSRSRHFHVAIVGGGFGGLGTAIRLKQEGVEDFVLFERSAELGGVWRDNDYPGCACDVPSHLYSFSFAPNPNWSRVYSPRSEIQAYLRDCATRFGVLGHVRLKHTVEDARWEDSEQRWHLRTSEGPFTADVLVLAAGAFDVPALPEVAGLERFRGKVMHSSRWDHDYSLTGRTVAVVGTGASAVQFVPAIQSQVEKLVLFQRTPPWVLPRNDRPIAGWTRWLYSRVPGVRWLMRAALYLKRELSALAFMYPWIIRLAQYEARRHLARSVPDEALRAKLRPDYVMGCKRVLISDDYLPALTRPNVEVVAEALQEVREHSVVTTSGAEYAVDTLILGTGFRVTEPAFARCIRGRGGRTLEEAWEGTMKAHLGTSVSGFPNFFMVLGPNTGLGHTTVLLMMESQVEHVLNALRYLEGRGLAAVEPTPDAQEAFVREVDARMARTVWLRGGCKSWYLDATGRNSTLWPGFTFAFKHRVSAFEPSEYVAIERHGRSRGRAVDVRPRALARG